MMSRMEKQGLVTKANDLHRKNVVRVFLTDKGWQLYHQATKRESIHMVMSCLSDEEGRQLVSSLKKLRNKAIEEFEIKESVHSVA